MASRRERWSLAGLLAAFLALYGGILLKLSQDWLKDDNYAHGVLVVPIVGYLVWQRRDALRELPLNPSAAGSLVVAGSLGVLLIGTAGIELFLTRVSLIGVLAGIVIYLFGWAHLRLLAFPLAFLLLMIPLPAIVFNHVTFPLQLVASRLGVATLQALEIPVLREGNVIVLANTTLEVAQACSGIRSLVSLLTLALLYGCVLERGAAVRFTIALSAVPVAILANGVRVAGAGAVAHYYGAEAATGFLHTFSGWFLFATSVVALVVLDRLARGVLPSGTWRPRPRWMAAS